jgi:hypothetical protein
MEMNKKQTNKKQKKLTNNNTHALSFEDRDIALSMISV